MKKWLKAGGVGAVCIVLCMIALPHVVSAHATPISYTPPLGTTELEVPDSVSIRFTERIELDASSITVFGPDGDEVQQMKGYISPLDERTFETKIQNDSEGVYTVSWQVVSIDDGHFTKGAYSFLVDQTGKKFEGNGGGVEITYVTRFPEAVFSFFSLLGESIFLGGAIFLLFFIKPLYFRIADPRPEFRENISFVFRHTFIFAFLFLLFGTVTVAAQKSIELSELQSLAFGKALFVYLVSAGGTHALMKLGLGLSFVLLFVLFQKKILGSDRATWCEWVMLIAVFCILYFQSASSHAAASLFYPAVSIGVTALHLFAKELVIGGSIILLILLRMHSSAAIWHGFRRLLPRFDFLVGVAILIAGTSGVFITWLHLKRPENLFDTEWGVRFIVLLLVTLGLGAFRLFHQFIVHPRFENSFLRKIYQVTLPGEVIVGLLVLFFSGYISLTTPPFIVEEFNFEKSAFAEGVEITLGAHRAENSAFRIELKNAENGEYVNPRNLIVTATNNEKGVGPNLLSIEMRANGVYVFPRADLVPQGLWNIDIILQRETGYDARGSFEIRYPEDFDATRYSDEIRKLDSFAQTLCIWGILIIVVSVVLTAHAVIQIRGAKIVHTGDIEQTVVPLSSRTRYGFLAVLLAIVFTTLYFLYCHVAVSDFERQCIADGHIWRQAFPTRDFEAVSPNALNGCFVHDGHYHFIDGAEYRAYHETL